MSSASLPVDSSFTLDDLITQLKVLQQLRPNERIASRGVLLRVDAADRTQFVRRWWSGEGRDDNLKAISRVIDHAIRRIHEGDEHLRDDLRKASEGIRNLLVTYQSDSLTTAQILLLLQKSSDCVMYTPDRPAIDLDTEEDAVSASLIRRRTKKIKSS